MLNSESGLGDRLRVPGTTARVEIVWARVSWSRLLCGYLGLSRGVNLPPPVRIRRKGRDRSAFPPMLSCAGRRRARVERNCIRRPTRCGLNLYRARRGCHLRYEEHQQATRSRRGKEVDLHHTLRGLGHRASSEHDNAQGHVRHCYIRLEGHCDHGERHDSARWVPNGEIRQRARAILGAAPTPPAPASPPSSRLARE